MGSSSDEDSWSTVESYSCKEESESECSTCSSDDDEDCSYKIAWSQDQPLRDHTNTLADFKGFKKTLFLREKSFMLKEKVQNDLEEVFGKSDNEEDMVKPEYQSSTSCTSGSDEEECPTEAWTATDTRKVFPFTAKPVMSTGTAKTPLDYFYLLFNQDFVQTLVDQINARGKEFAQKKKKAFTPTDVDEVYTLLSTHFMMGYTTCIAEDIIVGERPSLNIDFNTYMRKDRYLLLFRLLTYKTLGKESREEYRSWYEVAKPIADKFNNVMKALMVPGKNLNIEKETVLKFNEKNMMRVMKDEKPDRIRMHLLADDNGIFQRVFLVDPEMQVKVRGERIAKQLMEDFLDAGRALYTNVFYTSVALAEDFLKRKTYLTGVLKKNRPRNPAFLKYKPKSCKLPVRIYNRELPQHSTSLKDKKLKVKTEIVQGFNKQGVCVCKVATPTFKFHLLSTEFTAKPAVDKNWECEILEQSFQRIDMSKRDKQLCKCGPNLSLRNNRQVAYLFEAMFINAYLMYKVKTGMKMKFVNFMEEILYQMLPLEAKKEEENIEGQKKSNRANSRRQDEPDECILV